MPDWSADGQTLYYWKRVAGSNEQVIIGRHLVSGVEREMIRRRSLAGIKISPDGRYLATGTIDPTKNERVQLLLSLETGAAREIMRQVFLSSWLPDSQSFIARLQREPEGESELWHVPVNGAAPQPLSVPGPSVSPVSIFSISAANHRRAGLACTP